MTVRDAIEKAIRRRGPYGSPLQMIVAHMKEDGFVPNTATVKMTLQKMKGAGEVYLHCGAWFTSDTPPCP